MSINKVRLAESSIWQAQQHFYQNYGIQAWNGRVPYYATSNPSIAYCYAHIITQFIRETVSPASKAPVYIVELGSGSGTFAFYMLQALEQIITQLPFSYPKLIYVMTDIVDDNITFWEKHPALQPFLAQGKLDFARFDVQHDEELQLRHSAINLSSQAEHPMIVLANYLFDTLPHDLFRVAEHILHAGVVDKDIPLATVPLNSGILLQNLGSGISYIGAEQPYYRDPVLDNILADYAKRYQNRYFLMPIGGMEAIKRLRHIAHDRLLLLATDKGYAKHFDWYEQATPELVFHSECFSMMVNFHAVGCYFQQIGGDYYHQTSEQSIISAAYIQGYQFAQLPLTQGALTNHLDIFSPGNLFNLARIVDTVRFQCGLEQLVDFLLFSHWDSYLFNSCFDAILHKVKQVSASLPSVYDLCAGLPKLMANCYQIPGAINTPANIGLLLQELHHPEQALHYYKLSLDWEKLDTTFYNMGLCHVALEQWSQAIAAFEEALTVNPGYILARGWIGHIQAFQNQQRAEPQSESTIQAG